MHSHLVRFPLGTVLVKLDRRGMALADRGGFEAFWADEDAAMSQESYRGLVKQHFHEVYIESEGCEPPKIALNLASYQLIDDIIGWTKLNYRGQRAVWAKMNE